MSGIFEVTELVAEAGGEPRMSAALLAKRLGIVKLQIMRRLIERNDVSLRRFGEYVATVATYSATSGGKRVATLAIFSGRGRPAKDYLLNEGRALFVASRSETPVADEVLIGLIEVFMAWRHGRLGPVTSEADRVRLEANRTYYQSVPEATKAIAARVVAAPRQVEARIAQGVSRSVAIREISRLTGIGVRTIYDHWSKVRMVPEADWLAAVVRLYHQKRGMLAPCHPDALQLMTDLLAAGATVAASHRQVVAVAGGRGWGAIPCERTMRRYGKSMQALAKTGRAA